MTSPRDLGGVQRSKLQGGPINGPFSKVGNSCIRRIRWQMLTVGILSKDYPREVVFQDEDLTFVCYVQDTMHMQTVFLHSAGLGFLSPYDTVVEISAQNNKLLHY